MKLFSILSEGFELVVIKILNALDTNHEPDDLFENMIGYNKVITEGKTEYIAIMKDEDKTA